MTMIGFILEVICSWYEREQWSLFGTRIHIALCVICLFYFCEIEVKLCITLVLWMQGQTTPGLCQVSVNESKSCTTSTPSTTSMHLEVKWIHATLTPNYQKHEECKAINMYSMSILKLEFENDRPHYDSLWSLSNLGFEQIVNCTSK